MAGIGSYTTAGVLAKSFLVSIGSRPSINIVVNNPAQRRKARPQATGMAGVRRKKASPNAEDQFRNSQSNLSPSLSPFHFLRVPEHSTRPTQRQQRPNVSRRMDADLNAAKQLNHLLLTTQERKVDFFSGLRTAVRGHSNRGRKVLGRSHYAATQRLWRARGRCFVFGLQAEEAACFCVGRDGNLTRGKGYPAEQPIEAMWDLTCSHLSLRRVQRVHLIECAGNSHLKSGEEARNFTQRRQACRSRLAGRQAGEVVAFFEGVLSFPPRLGDGEGVRERECRRRRRWRW